MTLINGDATDFKFRLGYIAQSSGGMASFIKSDDTEKYFVLSRRENT